MPDYGYGGQNLNNFFSGMLGSVADGVLKKRQQDFEQSQKTAEMELRLLQGYFHDPRTNPDDYDNIGKKIEEVIGQFAPGAAGQKARGKAAQDRAAGNGPISSLLRDAKQRAAEARAAGPAPEEANRAAVQRISGIEGTAERPSIEGLPMPGPQPPGGGAPQTVSQSIAVPANLPASLPMVPELPAERQAVERAQRSREGLMLSPEYMRAQNTAALEQGETRKIATFRAEETERRRSQLELEAAREKSRASLERIQFSPRPSKGDAIRAQYPDLAPLVRDPESQYLVQFRGGQAVGVIPVSAPKPKEVLADLAQAFRIYNDASAEPAMREAAKLIIQKNEPGVTYRVMTDPMTGAQHIERLPSKGALPSVLPSVPGAAPQPQPRTPGAPARPAGIAKGPETPGLTLAGGLAASSKPDNLGFVPVVGGGKIPTPGTNSQMIRDISDEVVASVWAGRSLNQAMATISAKQPALKAAVRADLRERGILQALVPSTAATRQMSEQARSLIPHVQEARDLIAELGPKLGPLSGRFNEFMTGSVGVGPEYNKLRSLLGLLNTGMMRAHVGARGGVQIMDHFKGLWNAGRMDPATLNAGLDAMQSLLATYSKADRPGAAALQWPQIQGQSGTLPQTLPEFPGAPKKPLSEIFK